MTAPPIVGISGRRRPAAGAHDGPAALDELDVEVYFAGYADRLADAGALPLHIPVRADPGEVVARLDALVLTGGSDVDPDLYGASPRPGAAHDRGRDLREMALLAAALERGIPVLAICRGLQLLNVHFGGTLVQHLDHHPLGRDGAHDVTFLPGSVLHSVYGTTVPVNSLHHQSVDVVGNGLVAVGHAPDGVVEAAELPGRDVVGVQWHPEQLAHSDPIFAWMTDVASVARAASPGATASG
ncbi:gamma-glutamyl-gamma-aminobutyrate hydrolase family protein [Pseudonocardia endophytica]|uniref:Putative glutamine amidotransferase n=1 Tax=Pseudonocardia endophytica TaxID=401976 RepID=A0A4V2PIW9_PSEEN|nr:gamma-glutamyl-gamma-aminobutyrate hydrolase family protein [Pseudonocardia endophytica]TCK26206.1 putative glutamine amidotransferase [Pseudonocardia endophytica]